MLPSLQVESLRTSLEVERSVWQGVRESNPSNLGSKPSMHTIAYTPNKMVSNATAGVEPTWPAKAGILGL